MSKWSIVIILLFTGWIYSCNNSTGSPPVYTLETNVTPGNAGTITPSAGQFDERSEIELKAEAAEGYLFQRWDGDLESSSNPDLVMVDRDKSITAIFDIKEYILNIETNGAGSVREEIIDDPAKTGYGHGTTVLLTAVPEDGWLFDRWDGDMSGEENPVTISISLDKSVTVHFKVETFMIDLVVEGSGEVTLDPDNGPYQPGDGVMMTAEPADGWKFDRWEGDLVSNENPADIYVDSKKSVTAIFEEVVIEYISHGYVEGVSPVDEPQFSERIYPVIQAGWEGPGGDKRWLGLNLGATDAPVSYDDRNSHRAGWYFKYNDVQGYFHEGYNPEAGYYAGDDPIPSPFSSTRSGDPCTELFEDSWRIPTAAEWQAVSDAGAATELNLHAAGNITDNEGIITHSSHRGSYWSSTEYDGDTNAEPAVIAFHTGKVTGELVLTSGHEFRGNGLAIRCIRD